VNQTTCLPTYHLVDQEGIEEGKKSTDDATPLRHQFGWQDLTEKAKTVLLLAPFCCSTEQTSSGLKK